MTHDAKGKWIAFAGARRIASGVPHDVAARVKEFVDTVGDTDGGSVLVFDAISSQPVELDLRGPLSAVLARLTPQPDLASDIPPDAPRAVGRPKLGVVAREITLLPRHWDWLASQPGGASVALRKLVEQALHTNKHADLTRQAQESTFRFLTAIAGNEPGFEEATRALFASDHERFCQSVATWPVDVREHALALADTARADNVKLA